MSDYLVTQAIGSIWCTPEQDRQARYTPKKITRYGGVLTSVSVMWRSIRLPLMGQLFHVYQLGHVAPRQLGLKRPDVPNQWLLVSDICNSEQMIIDIYNVNGVQYPRHRVWYTVTEDDDLIFAIANTPKVGINLNEEVISIRFYSNAYYNSTRRDITVDYVEVTGMTVLTNADILTMQNKVASYAAINPSGVYTFINGYRTSNIDMILTATGDVVEIVYDGSISNVVDFDVRDLRTFDSTLDAKRKYVLHPELYPSSINYNDDVDVFLVKKDANDRFTGLYYHRNMQDAMRQLTHNDYAITVPYVVNFADSQGWGLDDVTIRLHIRKSGYRRSLAHEANRISELYKLPQSEILDAIIGVNALVPEWGADVLESAGYTEVMRSELGQITPAMVQRAYGYNAMSQLLAPTPQFTTLTSNQLVVTIPANLRYRSTVYEYDFDGVLLGWYQHAIGATWRCVNSNCHMVEIVTGYGTTKLEERYGQSSSTIDPTLDYRAYLCHLVGGVPDNNWTDVTGTSHYTVNGIGLAWTLESNDYTMLRSNRDFLGYNLQLPLISGVLRFTVTSIQDRGNGDVNTIMQVPVGEWDFFMNGHALVEGVDYIFNFPTVMIISKRYIDLTKPNQLITVRACGHCESDLSIKGAQDKGFVTHGVLSNNTKFDLRDDKVLHIAVNGAVYDRSELTFAETHSGVNVPGVPDGSPYSIRDIVVPMRGTTNANTYALRATALVTDQHVSDYLSLKLPAPTFTEPSSITSLYPVYSPFVSALIDDLASGIFEDDRMLGQYNDNAVKDMCKFYEPLLAFEPTYDEHKVDTNFVSVQPYYKDTVTELTVFQYRFLTRAVALYLNNAVSLSHYVKAVSA